MDRILPFIETYKGRDRILRLLCYLSKFAAGLIKTPQTASQYDNFSKQLSTSRACFRLLDDIPTIKDVLNSINKMKGESPSAKIVSALENTIDVIFNILDHMSWAIEHKIIISNSTVPDTTSTLCWVISLYITITKIVLKLSILSEQKLEIEGHHKKRELKKNLTEEQWYLKMSALKCLTDLIFAVNYLPKGLLWSCFFNKWQVGALGSFSSVVSLYQALIL